MVIDYSTQQQMNDVAGFGMSMLFMALMLGLLRPVLSEMFDPAEAKSEQEKLKMLPQTSSESKELAELVIALRDAPTEEERIFIKLTAPRRAMEQYRKLSFRQIRAMEQRLPKRGKPLPPTTVRNPELLPQVLAEDGVPMPPEYAQLAGWLKRPLPEQALLTMLPAVQPETGERRIDAILKQLKDGVAAIQDSGQFRNFLVTMSKFHEYSIGNMILIMVQRPDASHVAGFTTWKDLGRWVKKGEKGIAILAPVMPPRPTCPECGVRITKGARFCPKCGASVEELVAEGSPTYFRVVYVFDVGQTEGKPLPEFDVPVLTGAASPDVFQKMLSLARSEGLDVSFESRPGQDPEIKGMYSVKSIWVRPEESSAQQLKTLIHEIAHYFTEDVFHIPRRDAETIAESVAFAVGAHLGFDTGTRSFPYVALWSQDKKVLEQNLSAIRSISAKIIDCLEKLGQGVGD